jgi:predicted transcriptional regulator
LPVVIIIFPANIFAADYAMKIKRRRSNIEIIADMLRVGENGAGKTEIMYSANMSYAQIQKYLSFLINRGLIDKVKLGNPSVTYQVTNKGSNLLRSIDSIVEILTLKDEDS